MTTSVDAQARLRALIEGDDARIKAYGASVVSDFGTEADPTVDAEGKVLQYAVVYPSPPVGDARVLAALPTTKDTEWQVTVGAADPNECLWALDEVRRRVVGQLVDTSSGARHTTFTEVPGRRPPIAPDRSARPMRFFGVLLFQALVF